MSEAANELDLDDAIRATIAIGLLGGANQRERLAKSIERVLRAQRREIARELVAYRSTKPDPRNRPKCTGTPSERSADAWNAGFDSGERSGIYSSICRVDARALDEEEA